MMEPKIYFHRSHVVLNLHLTAGSVGFNTGPLLQGIETRASLDMSGMGNDMGNMHMGGKVAPPQLRQGRVIVGVTDTAQGEVFRNAYTQLGAPIECVFAMGPENVWNTCQQVRKPSWLANFRWCSPICKSWTN